MVRILDIPFYDRSLSDAVGHIIDICSSGEKKESRCVSASDAHVLVLTKRNPQFSNIMKKYYLNLPDGMPCVWIGRMNGRAAMERCYGPDIMRSVIIRSADRPIRHFLCGGQKGIADELRIVCGTKYHNSHVVGTFSPPFRGLTDDEMASLAEKIREAAVDIVWIGLSTPKQQLFAVRLSRLIDVHFIITVGAAFDFLTDRVAEAPRIIQRMGFEWFFRICVEPNRLIRRYLKVVPLFIYYSIEDWIRRID